MEAAHLGLQQVRPRSGSFSAGDVGNVRPAMRETFIAAFELRKQQEITSLKRRKIAKICLFASSGVSLGLGIVLAKVLAVTAFTLALPYIGAALAVVLFSTALYLHLKTSPKKVEHVHSQPNQQQVEEEQVRDEAPNPLLAPLMGGVFPYNRVLRFQPPGQADLLPPPVQEFYSDHVASLNDGHMRSLSPDYASMFNSPIPLLPALAMSMFPPRRTGFNSQVIPPSLFASAPSSMTLANERQVSLLGSNRGLPLAFQRSALRVPPIVQSLLSRASQPIQPRELQLLASATQLQSRQHFQVIRHLNHPRLPPVNIMVNYEVIPSANSPTVTVSRRILIEPLESSSGLKGIRQITQPSQIANSLPLAMARWVRGLVMPHSASPFFMSFQQSVLFPSRNSIRMVPTSGYHLFGLKPAGVNPFAYLQPIGVNTCTRAIAPLTLASRVQKIPARNGKLLTAGVSAVSIASAFILNKLMPQRKASYGMVTRFPTFSRLTPLPHVTKPNVNFSVFPWLGFASPRFAPAPVSHFASPFRGFSQMPPIARPFSGLSFGADSLLPTFKTVALIGSAPPFDFAKWSHTHAFHAVNSFSVLRSDPSSSSASSATLTNTELDETASLTASLTASMTASMTSSDTSSTANTADLSDSFFLNE